MFAYYIAHQDAVVIVVAAFDVPSYAFDVAADAFASVNVSITRDAFVAGVLHFT